MITQIVSSTDMIGRYKLNLPSNETDFNDFVQANEYEILIDLFGAELYKTFEDDEAATIWTNLLNGVDSYTDYNGYKRDWKGLKKMFVRYHYAEWILLEPHSITGMIEPLNENSTVLTRFRKQRISDKAYNEFLQEYHNAFDYLFSNYSSYQNFDLYFKRKRPRGLITSSNA